MEFSLSAEQSEMVATARAFSRKHLVQAQAKMEATKEFPFEAWERWSNLGMSGLMIPEEYGGSGQGVLSYVLCLEEVAAVSQTFALIWQIHSAVSTMVSSLGTVEQKQTWLPSYAAGSKTPALGLTEPDAGSDAGGVKTRAVRDEAGQWTLQGRKVFISNAGHRLSDGMVVVAVTGERNDGRKEISCFLVPNDKPGFKLGQSFEKMAWDGLDNREIIFDNVQLSDRDMLGKRGKGLSQALNTLTIGRVAIATLACGLGRACLEEALSYAKERKQFNKPISSFQLIQSKIADMAAKTECIRHLIHYVAWKLDQGEECQAEASMAKMLASQYAVSAATNAYQIHGGYGFMKEYRVNRLYREAQILEIGEGTTEIQKLIIARSLGC